jgi:hypothetical protein
MFCPMDYHFRYMALLAASHSLIQGLHLATTKTLWNQDNPTCSEDALKYFTHLYVVLQDFPSCTQHFVMVACNWSSRILKCLLV